MSPSSRSRTRLTRALRLSGSFQATRLFFRTQRWAWPIVAALVLGAAGWWVYQAVEGTMKRQLAAELTTIRDADVQALRLWMKQQESNAVVLAGTEGVVRAAQDLGNQDAKAGGKDNAGLLQAPAQATLRAYLAPRLQAMGYEGFVLVAASLRVVASDYDAVIGMSVGDSRRAFYVHALEGRPSVSTPFRSRLLLPDAQGQPRTGLPSMVVVAPVRDGQGKAIAVLTLRIRPEREFTEILRLARSGATGETYAFDRDGRFLSQSRFDDDLKQIGLLADLPDARSILTVEVRDPGVNMAEGKRPAVHRAEQPLTRMAADAVAGNSGVDADGYRDYRGVPVLGAWTWLPEYDLGVATEIEVAEAYRPLYVLRLAFGILFGLLILSAVAIFVFTLVMARQQRRLQQAVLAAKQLGQYTLQEKLGAGGMGTVFKARHALLRRPTAIKILDPDKVSEVAIARFEREVQLTSALQHPNTIAIYDYGKTPEALFYYVMEYLDGISLEQLVSRYGPQPEGRVVSILRQVCGSLAEAHAAGLVHRDVKPANILLNHRGGVADFVKVLDFGLAKVVGIDRQGGVTSPGSLTGTPLYLAPEAIERPGQTDARVDLYAVGCVGYFLLTGTPVFNGESIIEICRQHVHAEPEPPSRRLGRPVGTQLEALLLHCLAKKPENRPPGAAAIEQELAACAVPGWSSADADAWWQRFKPTPAGGSVSPTPTPQPGSAGPTVVYAPHGQS
jgi:hypothetical protein